VCHARHQARHAQLVLLHLLSHAHAGTRRSRISGVKGEDDGINAMPRLSRNAVSGCASVVRAAALVDEVALPLQQQLPFLQRHRTHQQVHRGRRRERRGSIGAWLGPSSLAWGAPGGGTRRVHRVHNQQINQQIPRSATTFVARRRGAGQGSRQRGRALPCEHAQSHLGRVDAARAAEEHLEDGARGDAPFVVGRP